MRPSWHVSDHPAPHNMAFLLQESDVFVDNSEWKWITCNITRRYPDSNAPGSALQPDWTDVQVYESYQHIASRTGRPLMRIWKRRFLFFR